jgi:glycosyltransferase A (GT-A) superfamily protein (DUF2064 family)
MVSINSFLYSQSNGRMPSTRLKHDEQEAGDELEKVIYITMPAPWP